MKKILILLLVILLFSYLVIPFAQAQEMGGKGLLSMVGDECYDKGDCTLCDFLSIFLTFARWGFRILGSLTLLMLIYGGASLIWAKGGEEQIKKAKGILTGTLTGFIIVIVAYTLVNFVITSLTGKTGSFFVSIGDQTSWYKECK